jgi:hypothetical protein
MIATTTQLPPNRTPIITDPGVTTVLDHIIHLQDTPTQIIDKCTLRSSTEEEACLLTGIKLDLTCLTLPVEPICSRIQITILLNRTQATDTTQVLSLTSTTTDLLPTTTKTTQEGKALVTGLKILVTTLQSRETSIMGDSRLKVSSSRDLIIKRVNQGKESILEIFPNRIKRRNRSLRLPKFYSRSRSQTSIK